MYNKTLFLIQILLFSIFIHSCNKSDLIIDCDKLITNCQIFEDSLNLQLDSPWFDQFYLNNNKGFVGGNYGKLAATVDGGSNWSLINTQMHHHINSIYFINDQIGFLGGKKLSDGYGAIFLATADGGQSWKSKIYKDTLGIDNLHFFDSLNGIARLTYVDAYQRYALSSTSDGGLNWKPLDIPYLQSTTPIVITNSRIYVSCEDDKLYMSKNKGSDWTNIPLPAGFSNGTRDMHFVNDMFGFIARNNLMFRTTDGGNTWEEITIAISDLKGMHFFNEREGFIIHHVYEYEDVEGVIVELPTYQGMKIFETKDGGLNWTNSELIKHCQISQNFQVFDDNNLISLGYGVNHQIRRN